MVTGFDLFREQAAGEYNRLSRQPVSNRSYVVARAGQIIRQVDQYLATPDLTEAEQFWLEVIKESFEELTQKAGRTP
jgi:hypothetical protein